MTHLDRKHLRDLTYLKSQAIAVALVIACGLSMMIMAQSLVLSLETTRDNYYQDHRFAQVFAGLKRAPQSVAAELAAIPGVTLVQTGITLGAQLDISGYKEPASGLFLSLPEHGQPVLNQLYLRRGRMIEGSDLPGQILAGEAFVEANKLSPGDEVSVVLYGRKQTLRIAGVVLSPEYIFETPPGGVMPDNRGFGVFWMPYKELATALNMDGAFNQVALALSPDASEQMVIAAIDRVLEPYGGLGAYGREHHASHFQLREEIRGLKSMAIAFPLIFLAVAAFMTNAVMSRQIALQREQIAILKAFGFSNWEVGLHYLKFAIVIVLGGTVIGASVGWLLGTQVVEMYRPFFKFPYLEFNFAYGSLFIAVFVSSFAAIIGVWGAMRTAMSLPPAEAMRPEPPSNFRKSVIERSGFGRALTPSLRMAFRNIERRPVRALLTSLALALATGLIIVPTAMRDGINYLANFQWDYAQRHTVSIMLIEAGPPEALANLRNMPGVTWAEPMRNTPVEIQARNHTRRLSITGLPRKTVLKRVIDSGAKQIEMPENGVVLSAKLAEVLDVRLGDTVNLHVLEGKRPVLPVPVSGLAEDYTGTAAYMEMGTLNRLLGEGDRLSGAYLTVDSDYWDDFLVAVKETPRIAGISISETARKSFQDTTASSMGAMQGAFMLFSTIVAFGIVYNNARISLSERQRELATLRVIGFTRGEVGTVLVGELVLLTLISLPIGLLIGRFFTQGIIKGFESEFIRLPLLLTPSNYAFAVLTVAVASILSAIFACRRLHQLDLVGALKAHD